MKSSGFRRPSILADAMEAMFAAVSFDADFNTAEKVVRHLFAERVRRADFQNQAKTAKLLCRRRCRRAVSPCRNTASKSKSTMPTTVCLSFPAIWANWVSCAVPRDEPQGGGTGGGERGFEMAGREAAAEEEKEMRRRVNMPSEMWI